MLGVAAVGAYRWYSTPAHLRVELPWHQQPWFWGIGLLLVGVLFLSTKVPGLRFVAKSVKQYVSAGAGVISALVLVEDFANSGSAPVARALAMVGEIVVPSVLAAVGAAQSQSGALVWLAWAGAALLGLIVMGAVWLLFNAIDVLVLQRVRACLRD